MRHSITKLVIIGLILCVSIVVVAGPLLAKKSHTFRVSCIVPEYVTMPDGSKMLAREALKQNEELALKKAQAETTEQKPRLVEKVVRVLSEDKSTVQIITSICAR